MRVRTLLLLYLIAWTGEALSQTVAFINPGRSDEPFWLGASQAMQAAAHSLAVPLEVLYAEREPERALQLARDIAARPAGQRPDYVILVNEKNTLVENARVLGAAGIKSFAAFSGLLPRERERWAPRQGLPQLQGSLEPQAEDAGYLTARALIRQALADRGTPRGQKLQMLAISGDRTTPVSIQRNEGLRRAVAESPEVELVQQSFADWRRDLAAEAMSGLLARHPQARLLWTGSDLMAFGAMDAIEAAGQQVVRDWRISSINTSNEAMKAVLDGRLKALAGGHFLAGAWALVMVYDQAHGHDFAADEGTDLVRPMFMLFGKAEAQRFLNRFGPGMPQLDFRPYSKALNPKLKQYRFEIGELLR
ncbi:ABC transporter substrate-binding protein [Pelomonas sp. SE-A7]|uniref:ABC transporter substrate-binding protein n=1 Tax=Pelomonas sp. SE-A7 TaxID=3054953 RepID=UPI00259C76AB|nr:ABC transporter substrate-binding protein [Pelomonas sp. SE-A7]MDM4766015.1 ABC transporter substrate-binding protein [Pelomonas sp. SE-A7]